MSWCAYYEMDEGELLRFVLGGNESLVEKLQGICLQV